MQETNNQNIVTEIQKDWSLQINPSISEDELIEVLGNEISHLITQDFSRLITLLYRIDINEKKLQLLLKENPKADAGVIIAHLIVERQKQKLKSRMQYGRGGRVSDEEEW
jgi:hypothetical protein